MLYVHHVKEVNAKGLIVALVWLWRPAEPKLAGGLSSVKWSGLHSVK